MTAPKPIISQPGLYDLTHKQYHDDPVPGGSLSSTGARKLTPPDGCPARFDYWRRHGEPKRKRELDLGQVAHSELLGIGPEVDVLDFDSYRTKAAQEKRDAAYEAGRVPILAEEMDTVQDMMLVLLEHPQAGKLFDVRNGTPEQSAFFTDPVFDITRRYRFDILSHLRHPDTGQLIIPDYKTTSLPAHPDRLIRSIVEHGYHQQGAWASDALKGVGLVRAGDPEPLVTLVFQETKPPYIVSVIELDRDKIEWGRYMNALAMQQYVDCSITKIWPAYSDGIMQLPPLAPFLKDRFREYLKQNGA